MAGLRPSHPLSPAKRPALAQGLFKLWPVSDRATPCLSSRARGVAGEVPQFDDMAMKHIMDLSFRKLGFPHDPAHLTQQARGKAGQDQGGVYNSKK